MKAAASRFPEDFAFRVSKKEFDGMRSQIVTTSKSRPTMWSQIVTTSQKYRRADSLPFAFTEQGVAMLSSVLRSSRAACDEYDVRGRRWIDCIGRMVMWPSDREDASQKFATVFAAIKQLIVPTPSARKRVGFHPDK
jgi:hypothetical protein